MPKGHRISFLPVTALTSRCAEACVVITCGTAAYLAWQYPHLPDLLAVHFAWNGRPNGWQYKTPFRVFLPLLVQLLLMLSLWSIAALLVWRRDASHAGREPDAVAAATASEAIMIAATAWIAFQAYGAFALLRVWHGTPSLGPAYLPLEVAAASVTAGAAIRAHLKLGKPEPLRYDPAHWRLGHLYCNADDPSLFVPTRDGRRWTLNFGRSSAVALLALILLFGVSAPAVLIALALR